MISAFGVDHGDFSKAYSKYGTEPAPSAGRRAAAGAFGGYHAIAAGKKGKKARAYGNVATRGIGGAGLGGGLGAGAAMLATRGNPTAGMLGGMAGGFAGGQGGIQRGVTINQRKGYYKKEE